ncbi:MAG: hypothetical protein H7326_10460 [Bdellovibrionaceae bacterium]|nr:hypothetical protein [Pseudobdellovibrionaceae bacterium]
MKKFKTLILLSGILISSVSFARFGGDGVLLDVNLYYVLAKSETKLAGQGTQQSSDLQSTIYDLKLGYIFPISWYVGIIHSSRSDSLLYHYDSYGSSDGISVGYMSYTGPYFMVHYLYQSNRGEYSRGTGVQIDVGCKFEANDHWVFGLEMSQRNLTYQKSDTNASLDYYKVAEVFPMASIGYLF